jgi:alkylhydroperoxidase family enzyme
LNGEHRFEREASVTSGRIPVPEAAELREDAAALLPLTAQPGHEPARTMAVLARQPDLLAPFIGWAAALALQGVLSHRDHELLALRAAWRCRSHFEWAEHVDFARAAGLDDGEIAAVADDAHTGWSPRDRALLDAADELVAHAEVSESSWRALATHFDQPALVEILFVVGQYTMLSMVANAAGIDAPDGAPPLP